MYGKKKVLLLVVEIYIFGKSAAAISTNFTDDYCKNNLAYKTRLRFKEMGISMRSLFKQSSSILESSRHTIVRHY
jgi:hypothetical protein